MARTSAVLCVGVLFLGAQMAAAGPQAGRGAQRPAPGAQRPAPGAQRPAPAAAGAPQPPSNPPQVSAIAVRVVGPGLGANGSELRPFNESPGTTVVLAVQAGRGSGIVEIDSRGGKVDSFADDKGQSLLEEGRVGPGQPQDVKITGDTAVAMLSGKEVKFARISNRWFIRLE